MIEKIEEIAITEASYPFSSAERHLHISEMGYEEKEYFMHGTANVYQTQSDGTIEIRTADAPYVNRFILYRPTRKEDFSGKVVVEILNATSGMDLERMWILGYREIMREGAAYIGITSKHNTVKMLKKFSPERYADLSWENPTPEVPFPFTKEEYIRTAGGDMGDLDINCESGLFWDMLSDLARILRADLPENPLADYHPTELVLTGWSQSADYMIRYINDFVYKDGEANLFDGFLLGGPPRSFVSPVSQYEAATEATPENVVIRKVKQPTIILQTESDNTFMDGMYARRRNSNASDLLIREYDIAGASHDTEYCFGYYGDDPDFRRMGVSAAYSDLDAVPNNYPSWALFDGAYRNLFHWIDTGAGPAECGLIDVTTEGDNVKDVYGNTIGGLRTCLIDVPTGAYYSWSHIRPGQNPMFPDLDRDKLYGHEEPFPAEMLKAVYGSLAHYRELAQENTRQQVSAGFVVREDAEELVNMAVDLAAVRGLK